MTTATMCQCRAKRAVGRVLGTPSQSKKLQFYRTFQPEPSTFPEPRPDSGVVETRTDRVIELSSCLMIDAGIADRRTTPYIMSPSAQPTPRSRSRGRCLVLKHFETDIACREIIDSVQVTH
ncbi:hypothetical protein J6590_053021 [Homalodisca vitripennis]|nr:hypothetical protein J6590_053021 [Homalodisca vitripennis]